MSPADSAIALLVALVDNFDKGREEGDFQSMIPNDERIKYINTYFLFDSPCSITAFFTPPQSPSLGPRQLVSLPDKFLRTLSLPPCGGSPMVLEFGVRRWQRHTMYYGSGSGSFIVRTPVVTTRPINVLIPQSSLPLLPAGGR